MLLVCLGVLLIFITGPDAIRNFNYYLQQWKDLFS